nr:hypothetical protein [Propionivibrio sp.]
MPPQILLPGVQHQGEGRRPAQPARVGRELRQRRRHRTKQSFVDRSRRHADQAVQIMRQGEHQMEYGTGNSSRRRRASHASLARVWHCGQCRLRQE